MSELEWLLAYTKAGLTLPDLLLLFMLIFCRWIVMSSVIPFLGAVLIPSLVRIALAGLLSLVSVLMILGKTKALPSLDIFTVIILFSKEVLLGFILGFLASLIFYAYELVGELLDFSRAASMLRLLVPQIKHQSSSMGTLLFQLSLTFFFALGLHRPMLEALLMSFERFPPFSLSLGISSESVLTIMLSVLGTLFELALRISLPVIFVCFLIDVAFGLLNRIAPQINAYFLSLPAKMLGGLTILFFILPLVMAEFESHNHKLSAFFKTLVVNSR
jgi:flagellar biosynthesis protein FliR